MIAMALFFAKLSENLLANTNEATKYIEQTIWEVAFQNVPERQPWIESVENNAKGIFYLAKGNKLPQPHLASEETVAMEKSHFDEAAKHQYETKIECFFRSAKKGLTSVLRENEKVELERFTYLEMPFESFPKYTPVFLRRTNLDEFFLVVNGYLVNVSQNSQKGSQLIYYQAPAQPSVLTHGTLSLALTIAKKLASALLSGVGSKVGALILDSIFPSGTPDYFDEVYKEIEKIVHQEITDNTIHEVNGQINGIKAWVAITYTNAKESGAVSKEELTELIQPRESQIAIQLLGVLTDARFAKAGLCVFMIGAGMHFAVLQELAFVDPKVGSPSNSHYANSIRDYAEKYANHAKSTFEAIVSARLGAVQPRDSYEYIDGVRYYFHSFTDHFSGYRSQTWIMYCDTKGCHDTNAEGNRNGAMAKYKEDTRNDLVQKMGDPVATANEWLKLKTQPLPSV